MPSVDEQNFNNTTTPIDYRPGGSGAPEAGRNIFAFYEPPPPTPYSPTPPPTPKPATPPPPTPTPEYVLSYVNPQLIYAGSKGFRLEANGDRFTPDVHIYFSQNEMPTTFINAQKLVTDIPANMITSEGPRQVIVQSPDGKKYSTQMMVTVQAAPKPTFQYIGMIGRKRYNNDTAYFQESGKPTPFGARLNDVVGGRFRLISITSAETVFEDVNLGFRHRIPIAKSSTGSGSSGTPSRPPDGGFPPNQVNPTDGQPCVPGIPCNIPRFIPQQPGKPPEKKDVDDNDDGSGNN